MNVVAGLLGQELHSLSQERHLVVRVQLQRLVRLLSEELQEDLFLDLEGLTAVEGEPLVELGRLGPAYLLHRDGRIVTAKVVDVLLDEVVVVSDDT